MDAKSAKYDYTGVKTRNYDTNNDDITQTRVLPESIVMDEILPRLPVKSLVRFQCVSKYWHATISKDPVFAKRHLNFSSLFRRHFFIKSVNHPFSGRDDDFFLLPYRKCSSEDDLVGLGYGTREEWCNAVGSCNGLVCLYHIDNDSIAEDWERERERKFYFEVWNPATHQNNVIDCPPGVYLGLAYGFGYVSSLDDYKIVCAFGTEREGNDVFRGFYVFSLRSGEWENKFGGYDYSTRNRKWRRIRNYPDEDRRQEEIVMTLKRQGFWKEGILYWPPDRWTSRRYIVGYDLATDEFIEYTSMVWNRGYSLMEMSSLKGCLALHCHKSDQVSEFWILKDIDDWGSWQLLFSVGDISLPFITISETGMCLVHQSKKFNLLDLSKEALESVTVDEDRCFANKVRAMDHVESLVSPFGMPESNEEEENLQITANGMAENDLLLGKRSSPPPLFGLKEVGMPPHGLESVNASREKISDIKSDAVDDCDSEDDNEDDSEYSDEYISDYEEDIDNDPEAYSDWESGGTDVAYSDEDVDDNDSDQDDEDEEEEEDDV